MATTATSRKRAESALTAAIETAEEARRQNGDADGTRYQRIVALDVVRSVFQTTRDTTDADIKEALQMALDAMA
ncbi:MAG: hypothetical protein ACTHKG_06235 [Nocardioides sp.]